MNEQDELRDEYEAQFGDPRRCPHHGCVTSSPDGMFDAPCPECEGEMMEGEIFIEDLPSDAFEDWRDDALIDYDLPF